MRQTLSSTLAIVCASVFAACSEPADRVEITETSTRSETRPVPRVNATSDERFARIRPSNPQPPEGADPHAATSGDAPEPAPDLSMASDSGIGTFTYDVPAGWTEIAPTQFRNPNFTAGANGEIECYVSVLSGDGGGQLVNANRWRSQLGRAPYSERDFAALPRATVLGSDAVIVDFEGDYSGMGAAEVKPGYRLVGALIQTRDSAVFIKMVGPDAAVNAEKDNFARFAQSLKMTSGEQLVQETPRVISDSPPPASAPSQDAAGYAWDTPDGWAQDPAGSPMRLVTFRFGPDNSGECYVAVLPGAAGGRLDNFNRWLAQMGEPPLEETEVALQPTVFLFEEEVPMLIAQGTYTGMGGESRPNHVMFGAISTVNGESVFVKLIAPEAIANENLAKFRRFCGSLKKP